MSVEVSVCIPTYNHEKYIARALDSVLMQKINFNMEVWVGDDASTDRTADILKEYEKRYPGFFKMVYRKENTYKANAKIKNGKELSLRCKGKYIIMLEGDDYWISPQKLQMQYDFLEHHSEYIAVAHNVDVVDKNGNATEESYPECKKNKYTIWDYLFGIFPGQTASLMSRNFYKMPEIDTSIIGKLSVGDNVKVFLLLGYGKIWCIQSKLSAYRHVTSGGSSFSANHQFNYEEWNRDSLEIMRYAQQKRFDLRMVVVSEILYIQTLMSGVKKKYISVFDLFSKMKEVDHKILSGSGYFIFFLIKKIKSCKMM